MSNFVINGDMFGAYVKIPTGYSRDMHLYKVVSHFQSNTYCDIPIVYNSQPVPHQKEFRGLEDLEHVLNVIHCGIDETKVVRVALKDCEIVKKPELCKNCLGCPKCGTTHPIYECVRKDGE